jgi:tetratricopeptide (TPR) repeat protein/predicted Ser/Thr protein kinase
VLAVSPSSGLGDGSLDDTGVAPSAGVGNGPTTLREPVAFVASRASGFDRTAVGAPSTESLGEPLDPTQARLESALFTDADGSRRIGRYQIIRALGSGGMGVVYAAWDEELERRVAIKVVRDDRVDSTQGTPRMLREAKAMAEVSHPNVVQVYDVGSIGPDQVFVAMEFVKGETLSDWLASERTWEDILEMFQQAGRGLAAAHRQGLVHRDFKPDNVLVGADGRARVLDFGLARRERARSSEGDSLLARVPMNPSPLDLKLTAEGTILGTPAFMSPEQHLGESADARSDQFSFCVALYGALYGQAPFTTESMFELREAVITGALRPPPADTAVPAWVFAALKVGLAVDPNDRYPSMDTLLAAFTVEETPQQRRRWLWPAALVGASTLAVLVTLRAVAGEAPGGDDLEQVQRLSAEARDAASRGQWVYPRPADPRDTAYGRVVLLEGIDGPAAGEANAAATGLRAEFAAALVVLGDRYFDDELSRPYARDYYVQALVFEPDDARARERAGTTLGQIAELQGRAARGDFIVQELIAAEPLRILANPGADEAHRDALAFAGDPEASSALGRERATSVFRKSGLLGADDLAPKPPPPEPAAPAPEPVVEVAPPPSEPPPEPAPTRPPRDRKGKPPPADTKAPPPEPPPIEDEPAAKVDPEASKALVAEADVARRRGDAAAAERLYNQALDLWNRNAAALVGISDLAFERGDFERAVKYAEKAVRAEPERGDYLIRLGDAYFKVYRYSDAQQRYAKAETLGHPKAAERLARVKAKLGG